MKRFALVFMLLILSLDASAQLVPSPVSAYVSTSPGVWEPLADGSGSGALGYTPPPAALYCQTAVNAPWTPCTGTGGGGGLPTATAQYQVPLASGAGTTYTAGFLPYGQFANQNANLSLANGNFTTTFANTLAQATGAYTLQNQWTSGTVNVPSIYQGFRTALGFGTLYASMLNLTSLDVPSGSTTTEADGFASYVTGESTATDGVAGSFTAVAGAANAPMFAINANVWDNGFSVSNLYNAELDSVVANAATRGEVLRIYSKIATGGVYNGIHFFPYSSGDPLTNAIVLDKGTAKTAINIGELAAGTTSMPISFTSSAGTGALTMATDGFLNFSSGLRGTQLQVLFPLTTGACQYTPFGAANSSNNAIDIQFCNTGGTGSSSNNGGIILAGQSNPNVNFYTNISAEFGETTPAAGPANGIAVGTTGQATIDGSGNGTFTKVNVASARKGTFVCTSGGTVTVANTLAITTSDIILTMNTLGGTPSGAVYKNGGTSGTNFTVACSTGDTSTYNYDILN